MGGFECADHLNCHGEKVNLLQETQHDIRAEKDYCSVSEMGIGVVREGICWSEVERSEGEFDFSEVLNRIRIAETYGIQQIWDLIHFGYPHGLFPTHPKFCERFEKLCIAFAQFYKIHVSRELLVIPINEISFLSWLSGEVRGTVPYAVHSGWDIKYHLCKAAIAGIRALKSIMPECRIIIAEPLIKIHNNGVTDPDEVGRINDYQYQAMDIIAGRLCPELGGHESFLDILGFNYYWNCQWTLHSGTLPWPEPEDEKKRDPLYYLLKIAYERYKRPLFISETGHFGIGRIPWIEEITRECIKAIKNNIPLLGVCVYPVIDRPDWDDLRNYSNCGIFDLDPDCNRIPNEGYIRAIIHSYQLLIKSKKEMSEALFSGATGNNDRTVYQR